MNRVKKVDAFWSPLPIKIVKQFFIDLLEAKYRSSSFPAHNWQLMSDSVCSECIYRRVRHGEDHINWKLWAPSGPCLQVMVFAGRRSSSDHPSVALFSVHRPTPYSFSSNAQLTFSNKFTSVIKLVEGRNMISFWCTSYIVI